MELGTILGLSLAAVILLAVAAVVAVTAAGRRRFAAAAPRRQAEWPIRTDLGPVVSETDTDTVRLTVHENGFAATEQTGVTYTARWCDILDVTVLGGHPNMLVSVAVEYRTDKIPVFGPADAVRPFLDRVRAELASRER